MAEGATPLLKVHLGCGSRHIPGWVHVDLEPWGHVDHVQDIRALPMFDDQSVEIIYCCQALAYFDENEVKGVLKEWRRVLRAGGTLRLSVPNFAVVAKMYLAGLPLVWFIGTLYGMRSPAFKGNATIYHRTTYDLKSIIDTLEDAGFVNVRTWDWRLTEHAVVDDLSQAYFPHMAKYDGIPWNLNVEANKL